MRNWNLYLVTVVLAIGFTAASFTAACITAAFFTSKVARAAESDAEAVARLRNEITAAIGEAKCRNLVNCRIVGLGVRPCGGPEEYVAYSIWNTDREQISILVSEYNLLKEDLMLDSAEMGTCEVLPEPDVNCIRSQCVMVPGSN